jgi:hypothetical protein
MVVERLDEEVVRQLFSHLDAFHVRAVDDAELEAAQEEVERCTAEVQSLAAVVPTHPTAVASHQSALEASEAALAEAEDRLHDLTASLGADGPEVRQLRDEWPDLILAERREILRAGIDAVEVHRAPTPGSKVTPAERIRVRFRK